MAFAVHETNLSMLSIALRVLRFLGQMCKSISCGIDAMGICAAREAGLFAANVKHLAFYEMTT